MPSVESTPAIEARLEPADAYGGLLEDCAQMTITERLRAATKAARVLQRLRDAKTEGR